MQFISKTKEGKITGVHRGALFPYSGWGTQWYGDEFVQVPDDADIRTGDFVSFYTANWRRKSERALTEEGLISPPPAHILDGDSYRLMTGTERIVAGIDPPPAGKKIVAGEIVDMTTEEQLATGQITQTEYNAWKVQQNEAEYARRLSALMSTEAKARAEVDANYAGQRKTAITALLAVKTAPGWPLSTTWPTNTDSV